MTQEMINTLSLAALVVAHNHLASISDLPDDVADVKTFKNKSVGREKTIALFEAVNKDRLEHNLPAVVIGAEGKLLVLEADKPETETPIETPTETPVEAVPEPKKTGKKPGKPSSVSPSDIIVLLVADNPKRATAADRFARYRTGMTVGEYREQVGEAQGLRDILWDSGSPRKWIQVVGPKAKVGKEARAAYLSEPEATETPAEEVPVDETPAEGTPVPPVAETAPATEGASV